MSTKDKAWSGDLYELTWFFFRSLSSHYAFKFGRREGSKYTTLVLRFSYWGFHGTYTNR